MKKIILFCLYLTFIQCVFTRYIDKDYPGNGDDEYYGSYDNDKDITKSGALGEDEFNEPTLYDDEDDYDELGQSNGDQSQSESNEPTPFVDINKGENGDKLESEQQAYVDEVHTTAGMQDYDAPSVDKDSNLHLDAKSQPEYNLYEGMSSHVNEETDDSGINQVLDGVPSLFNNFDGDQQTRSFSDGVTKRQAELLQDEQVDSDDDSRDNKANEDESPEEDVLIPVAANDAPDEIQTEFTDNGPTDNDQKTVGQDSLAVTENNGVDILNNGSQHRELPLVSDQINAQNKTSSELPYVNTIEEGKSILPSETLQLSPDVKNQPVESDMNNNSQEIVTDDGSDDDSVIPEIHEYEDNDGQYFLGNVLNAAKLLHAHSSGEESTHPVSTENALEQSNTKAESYIPPILPESDSQSGQVHNEQLKLSKSEEENTEQLQSLTNNMKHSEKDGDGVPNDIDNASGGASILDTAKSTDGAISDGAAQHVDENGSKMTPQLNDTNKDERLPIPGNEGQQPNTVDGSLTDHDGEPEDKAEPDDTTDSGVKQTVNLPTIFKISENTQSQVKDSLDAKTDESQSSSSSTNGTESTDSPVTEKEATQSGTEHTGGLTTSGVIQHPQSDSDTGQSHVEVTQGLQAVTVNTYHEQIQSQPTKIDVSGVDDSAIHINIGLLELTDENGNANIGNDPSNTPKTNEINENQSHDSTAKGRETNKQLEIAAQDSLLQDTNHTVESKGQERMEIGNETGDVSSLHTKGFSVAVLFQAITSTMKPTDEQSDMINKVSHPELSEQQSEKVIATERSLLEIIEALLAKLKHSEPQKLTDNPKFMMHMNNHTPSTVHPTLAQNDDSSSFPSNTDNKSSQQETTPETTKETELSTQHSITPGNIEQGPDTNRVMKFPTHLLIKEQIDVDLKDLFKHSHIPEIMSKAENTVSPESHSEHNNPIHNAHHPANVAVEDIGSRIRRRSTWHRTKKNKKGSDTDNQRAHLSKLDRDNLLRIMSAVELIKGQLDEMDLAKRVGTVAETVPETGSKHVSDTGDKEVHKSQHVEEKTQQGDQTKTERTENVEKTEKVETTTEHTEKAAEQTQKAAVQTVKATEQPVKATEQPVKATEQPVKAAEQSTKAAEQTEKAAKPETTTASTVPVRNTEDEEHKQPVAESPEPSSEPTNKTERSLPDKRFSSEGHLNDESQSSSAVEASHSSVSPSEFNMNRNPPASSDTTTKQPPKTPEQNTPVNSLHICMSKTSSVDDQGLQIGSSYHDTNLNELKQIHKNLHSIVTKLEKGLTALMDQTTDFSNIEDTDIKANRDKLFLLHNSMTNRFDELHNSIGTLLKSQNRIDSELNTSLANVQNILQRLAQEKHPDNIDLKHTQSSEQLSDNPVENKNDNANFKEEIVFIVPPEENALLRSLAVKPETSYVVSEHGHDLVAGAIKTNTVIENNPNLQMISNQLARENDNEKQTLTFSTAMPNFHELHSTSQNNPIASENSFSNFQSNDNTQTSSVGTSTEEDRQSKDVQTAVSNKNDSDTGIQPLTSSSAIPVSQNQPPQSTIVAEGRSSQPAKTQDSNQGAVVDQLPDVMKGTSEFINEKQTPTVPNASSASTEPATESPLHSQAPVDMHLSSQGTGETGEESQHSQTQAEQSGENNSTTYTHTDWEDRQQRAQVHDMHANNAMQYFDDNGGHPSGLSHSATEDHHQHHANDYYYYYDDSHGMHDKNHHFQETAEHEAEKHQNNEANPMIGEHETGSQEEHNYHHDQAMGEGHNYTEYLQHTAESDNVTHQHGEVADMTESQNSKSPSHFDHTENIGAMPGEHENFPPIESKQAPVDVVGIEGQDSREQNNIVHSKDIQGNEITNTETVLQDVKAAEALNEHNTKSSKDEHPLTNEENKPRWEELNNPENIELIRTFLSQYDKNDSGLHDFAAHLNDNSNQHQMPVNLERRENIQHKDNAMLMHAENSMGFVDKQSSTNARDNKQRNIIAPETHVLQAPNADIDESHHHHLPHVTEEIENDSSHGFVSNNREINAQLQASTNIIGSETAKNVQVAHDQHASSENNISPISIHDHQSGHESEMNLHNSDLHNGLRQPPVQANEYNKLVELKRQLIRRLSELSKERNTKQSKRSPTNTEINEAIQSNKKRSENNTTDSGNDITEKETTKKPEIKPEHNNNVTEKEITKKPENTSEHNSNVTEKVTLKKEEHKNSHSLAEKFKNHIGVRQLGSPQAVQKNLRQLQGSHHKYKMPSRSLVMRKYRQPSGRIEATSELRNSGHKRFLNKNKRRFSFDY